VGSSRFTQSSNNPFLAGAEVLKTQRDYQEIFLAKPLIAAQLLAAMQRYSSRFLLSRCDIRGELSCNPPSTRQALLLRAQVEEDRS
jgi:hypothetical protein